MRKRVKSEDESGDGYRYNTLLTLYVHKYYTLLHFHNLILSMILHYSNLACLNLWYCITINYSIYYHSVLQHLGYFYLCYFTLLAKVDIIWLCYVRDDIDTIWLNWGSNP